MKKYIITSLITFFFSLSHAQDLKKDINMKEKMINLLYLKVSNAKCEIYRNF